MVNNNNQNRTYAFPEAAVHATVSRLDRFYALHAKPKTSFREAINVYDDLVGSIYHFNGCMHSGNYAPFVDEILTDGIGGSNCTTLMPTLYIGSAHLGLMPEIVQFHGFRDISSEKDRAYAPSSSHFALIVKVNGKDYLMDPFQNKFGKIKAYGDGYIDVARSPKNKAFRREFEKVMPYTEEKFMALMEHCRTQEGALEMLIAGQKIIKDRRVAGIPRCDVAVYYDDDTNVVSTRLYAPMPGIKDKAVFNHIQFDDDGKVTSQTLEFAVASGFHWDHLPEQVTIAELPIEFLEVMQNELKSLVKSSDSIRLGQVYLASDAKEHIDTLALDLILSAPDNFVMEALERKTNPKSLIEFAKRDDLKMMILARTLYEFEATDRDHVYDEETRIGEIRRRAIKLNIARMKSDLVGDRLLLHNTNLDKLTKEEAVALRRKRNGIEKRGSVHYHATDCDLLLRSSNLQMHDRITDQLTFAKKRLAFATMKDMEAEIQKRGLNTDIGYLAMVLDYIPVTLAAKKWLELTPFMHDLPGKVKARRAYVKAKAAE
jgi:hypothetical protein